MVVGNSEMSITSKCADAHFPAKVAKMNGISREYLLIPATRSFI